MAHGGGKGKLSVCGGAVCYQAVLRGTYVCGRYIGDLQWLLALFALGTGLTLVSSGTLGFSRNEYSRMCTLCPLYSCVSGGSDVPCSMRGEECRVQSRGCQCPHWKGGLEDSVTRHTEYAAVRFGCEHLPTRLVVLWTAVHATHLL